MITWANAERQACEVDCRRATIYRYSVLCADKSCECLFELRDEGLVSKNHFEGNRQLPEYRTRQCFVDHMKSFR